MKSAYRAALLILGASSFLGAVWPEGWNPQTGERLAFEVASFKQAAEAAPGVRKGGMSGGPGTEDPGQITIQRFPLLQLILRSYGVRIDQVKGPDWLRTELYDIVAKVPPGATVRQAREMMQNLIETRLRMSVRRVVEEGTVIDLVVAKGGPKMQETPASDLEIPEILGSPNLDKIGADGFPELPKGYVRAMGAVDWKEQGRLKTFAIGESMAKFAEHLSRQLRMTVSDQTGLTGLYNFSFIWTPEASDNENANGARPGVLAAGAVGPSIYAAAEKELGIQLQKKKAPVEVLVIDHAEKKPIEN